MLKKNQKIFTVISHGESKGVFKKDDLAIVRYNIWKSIMDDRSDYTHISSSNSLEFIMKDIYQNESGHTMSVVLQEMFLEG